jgi:hypothetical protein
MIERQELLKCAGDTVKVLYVADKKDCFVIGWFYALSADLVHLKITSTRFETYENMTVPVESIQSLEPQEMS